MFRRRASAIFLLLFAAFVVALPSSFARQTDAQQAGKRPGKRAGGAGPAAATRIDSPFAGPEDQKLMTFGGAWQEDVRYAGDPEASPSGKGRWLARPMFGLYLILNYEGTGPEGDYHAHGVMAYNHEDRNYRLWWFDDAGGIGEYTGVWKDDSTIVFEHKKNSGGRPFRERITYSKTSDDEVTTKIEQAWGTEAYKFYMQASAQRAQLQEGKGWGEKLSQQQSRRKARQNSSDSVPPAQQKPPK
jgi:Protein of unknown function (DUF1579)